MSNDKTYCDFLILAPLDVEIDAILTTFEEHGWVRNAPDQKVFPAVYEFRLKVGENHTWLARTTTLIQLNNQGVLNASVDSALAFAQYEAGYTLSYGIAGSISDDAKIGGVVLSSDVFYYEPSKDKNQQTQSRIKPVTVGSSLTNPFRQITSTSFDTHVGPIASGEKLFADIKSTDRRNILSVNDKILVVEMEAAGVGKAASELSHATEFTAIKGVSDSADSKKNRISNEEQSRNRSMAARHAAVCVEALARTAPLRRFYRSMPRPSEAIYAEKAKYEMDEITSSIEPFGIKTDPAQLYQALYGRRGKIPCYYRWNQNGPSLHWVDFKILSAMARMPADIVELVPIATLKHEELIEAEPWQVLVESIAGCRPTTNLEIDRAQHELVSYMHNLGFSSIAEAAVRESMKEIDVQYPEAILSSMRFMIGQFRHKRLLVFTWRPGRNTWMKLSHTIGYTVALFHWSEIRLSERMAKQEDPGKSLFIELEGNAPIKSWLNTKPSNNQVEEFLSHIDPLDKFLLKEITKDPTERLNAFLTALSRNK